MNNRGGVLWDENEVSDHNVSRLQQNTIAETKITELPTFETPPQTPVCEPPVSNPPPPSTSSATTPTSTLSSLYSHFYPASSPSSSPPNKPVPTSSTPSFLFPSTTFLFASSPSPPALLQSPSDAKVPVLKDGWMVKKGGIMKTWRKRYFQLTSDGKLNYYKNVEDTSATGTIDVNVVTEIKPVENNTGIDGFLFELESPQRTFSLLSETEKERNDWVLSLQVYRSKKDALNSATSTSTSDNNSAHLQEEIRDIFQSEKKSALKDRSLLDKLFQTGSSDHAVQPTRDELREFLEISAGITACRPPTDNFHKRNMQMKVFSRWITHHLPSHPVRDLSTDLCDGFVLSALVQHLVSQQQQQKHKQNEEEATSGHGDFGNESTTDSTTSNGARLSPSSNHNMSPASSRSSSTIQRMQSINQSLRLLREVSPDVDLSQISADAILRGNLKTTLDLLWTLVYTFQIQKKTFQGYKGASAVSAWFYTRLQPYDVHRNKLSLSACFQEATCLCALIDSFDPSFGYHQLPLYKKMEMATLALETANVKWQVPKLFDAEDFFTPDSDELSCLTYLALCFENMHDNLQHGE